MSGFDYAPPLAGDLVALRPLRAEDREPLCGVARDPAHDRWQENVFRRFFDTAPAAGGGMVAIDCAGGAVIGSSRCSAERAGPDEIKRGDRIAISAT